MMTIVMTIATTIAEAEDVMTIETTIAKTREEDVMIPEAGEMKQEAEGTTAAGDAIALDQEDDAVQR